MTHTEVSYTSLSDIIRALWQNKWKVSIGTLIGAIFGVVIAFSLTEMYRSQAVLAPASNNSSGGLGALAGQLGGIASIAGVDLGGQEQNHTALAIEIMNSHKFLSDFIIKHQLAVPLFAYTGYDYQSSQPEIDASIYDTQTKTWYREPDALGNQAPNEFDLVKEFRKQIDISEDNATGFVTIQFYNPSPEVANLVVNQLIATVNETVRMRDMEQAQKSIAYLESELAKTSIFEMRKVFNQLVEEQTKALMLSKVKTDYVFDIIDPAYTTLKPERPNKPVIVIAMFLLGFLLMLTYVLVFKLPKLKA